MPLILGDTSQGSFTLLQQPNGAIFIFKKGNGEVFAQFHMDRDKCRFLGQKLVNIADVQNGKADLKMNLKGGQAT